MNTTKVEKNEQSSTNVNTTDKQNSSNEELIKKYEVKNTPFTIIKQDNKVYGVMGQYRLTEDLKSVKKAKEEMKKITWDRLMQVVTILFDKAEEIKEFNRNLNK
jgi:thioredoxin-related protein